VENSLWKKLRTVVGLHDDDDDDDAADDDDDEPFSSYLTI
jgi:hypothetical protein